MTDKAEFTLVRDPTAADIVALFEQIKGRKATDQERQTIEKEIAQDDRREHEIIATLERLGDRKLTEAEVYLALEQARAVGEL